MTHSGSINSIKKKLALLGPEERVNPYTRCNMFQTGPDNSLSYRDRKAVKWCNDNDVECITLCALNSDGTKPTLDLTIPEGIEIEPYPIEPNRKQVDAFFSAFRALQHKREAGQ